MTRLVPLLLVLSQGCLWITESQLDFDRDGFCPAGFEKFCPQPIADCDNSDPNVNRPTTYYEDADGDTFGNEDATLDACVKPEGYVEDSSDCNDDASDEFPGALWYGDSDGDGYGFGSASPTGCKVDPADVSNNNDCNDLVADENPDVFWYPDEDGDGWGDAGRGQSCQRGSLANPVGRGGDCDDTNPTVFPNAAELCDGIDNSCQFSLDANEVDNDGDGYVECIDWVGTSASVLGGGDCDDTEEYVYPGSPEACDGLDNNCDGTLPETEIDNDGDTWVECAIGIRGWAGVLISGGNDCDDTDGSTYPGSPELCDGLSNSCSALPAEEIDDDGDGYVDCVIDPYVPWLGAAIIDGGDCDDDDDTIYPGALEVCDGQINFCGGELPENEKDNDGDGYVTCIIHGEGWDGDPIDGGQDCNDTDPTVHPGAVELCDGQVNACGGGLPVNERDVDRDGYVACTVGDLAYWLGQPIDGGDDCNDADATVYPTAPELCDGQINNCGQALPGAELDGDVDGYVGCAIDAGGWDGEPVDGGGDCDDTDTRVHPGATELCDGRVNDCNMELDPIETDADGDQWVGCDLDPGGWFGGVVLGDGDCNDNDATVYPGATEVCDGQLNNCSASLPPSETDDDGDGYVECTVDGGGWDGPEGTGPSDCDDTDPVQSPAVSWYTDNDGDGHGNPSTGTVCVKSDPYKVSLGDDCNDFDPDNYAGCTTCRDADNDGDFVGCDDYVNRSGPDCDDTDKNENLSVLWFADGDGDGFGDPYTFAVCQRLHPSDVSDSTDCDDADPDNWQSCLFCDDLDRDGYWDNCDNYVNRPGPDCDDLDPQAHPDVTWYIDADGDGFGDPNGVGVECQVPDPEFYATNRKDCDDFDPDNWDSCNTCVDADNDNGFVGCDAYVMRLPDCDDTDALVGPNSDEKCNGVDDNCDGVLDPSEEDPDGDGYVACTFDVEDGWLGSAEVVGDDDCEPYEAAVYPGAAEICDGLDNDCANGPDDGLARTTWYADSDGDGYGTPSTTTTACAAPVGFVGNTRDCNDSAAAANPGRMEVCNDGLDNDCDAATVDNHCRVALANPLVGARLSGADSDTALGQAMDVAPGAVPTLFIGAPDDDTVYGPWLPALSDARIADVSFPGFSLGVPKLGAAVQAADFDGDGRVEVLAATGGNTAHFVDGALGVPYEAGCLQGLTSGGSFATLTGHDTLGTTPELLVGVPLSGKVAVMDWSQLATLPTCTQVSDLTAEHTGTTLGYDVAAIGDVDGDSVNDYGATDLVAKTAMLVLAGGTEIRLTSTGQTVAVQGLGDLDEDGYDDIAVVDATLKQVTIVFGRADWVDAALPSLDPDHDRILRLNTPGSGPRRAGGIAAGDIDGDGVRDVVLGDPTSDAVYILYGPLGTGASPVNTLGTVLIGAAAPDPDGDADAFGQTIELADFDGDGLDDVVIGVPNRGGTGPGSDGPGEIVVIFGADL